MMSRVSEDLAQRDSLQLADPAKVLNFQEIQPRTDMEPAVNPLPLKSSLKGGELTQPLRVWTTHSKITIAWQQTEVRA